MTERAVTYTCKILPFGTIASVVLVTNLSVGAIFLTSMTGIPLILNAILLVVIMVIAFYYISATATFVISDTILIRTLDKKSFLFKNSRPKQYTWGDIRAFKNGTDRGKYRGEYQYLEIKFKDGQEWTITDVYGERKAEYNPLLQLFLASVNQFNEEKKMPPPPVPHSPSSTSSIIPAENQIKREKTIYETIYGKIFTVLLGVLIIAFLVYGLPYMGSSSLIKLYLFLIPGFFYVAYRVFIKKK